MKAKSAPTQGRSAFYGSNDFLHNILPFVIYKDNRKAMVLFKVIVRGFEVRPELGGCFVIRVQLYALQVFHGAGTTKLHREYVYRNEVLACVFGIYSQDIYFFDEFVGEGDTTDGKAATMDIDLIARFLLIAQDFVREIRVIDPQRQVVVTIRIKVIDIVESFRYLLVTFLTFRAHFSRQSTYPVGFKQPESIGSFVFNPDLQFTIQFERA